MMEGNSPFHEVRVVGFEAMVGIWSGRSIVAFVKDGGGKWIGKAVVVVKKKKRASQRANCLNVSLSILLDGWMRVEVKGRVSRSLVGSEVW
jgi:hypothetical protein